MVFLYIGTDIIPHCVLCFWIIWINTFHVSRMVFNELIRISICHLSAFISDWMYSSGVRFSFIIDLVTHPVVTQTSHYWLDLIAQHRTAFTYHSDTKCLHLVLHLCALLSSHLVFIFSQGVSLDEGWLERSQMFSDAFVCSAGHTVIVPVTENNSFLFKGTYVWKWMNGSFY